MLCEDRIISMPTVFAVMQRVKAIRFNFHYVTLSEQDYGY